MLSDFKISQQAVKLPIVKIASRLGINKKYLVSYGEYIAKIDSRYFQKKSLKKKGKYILVTAVTPTALGEGKTVTTIGLSMALNRLGKLSAVCMRQPSLGPVFGIKGSAGGGGYSQVLPREDFDLHFTGDAHAVGLAHNVAAAFLDNSLFRGNKLGIDPNKIYWRRVVDIGDRFLRHVRIGLGGKMDGVERESGFDITAASEIMAILALSKDARDLRQRIGRIILAQAKNGRLLTTEKIKVAGLMAVLLKDAIEPNLIQTIENTPCFVHTGPFANIAHGNSSLIADKIALALCDYVVTEAGFGADCGAEKFFNIKCRASGLKPDAAVLVCSLRALKSHGPRGLSDGLPNLAKQIENVKIFNLPCVVAINKFPGDSLQEIEIVRRKAREFGADDCQVSEVFAKGSSGGVNLAKSVIKLAAGENKFKLLYSLDASVKEKINTIAVKIYGAAGVSYSPEAEKKIREFSRFGWSKLPICMAKTQFSLSHDPDLKGRPQGFILPVRDIKVCAGAGFLAVLCGNIQAMPGLPAHPRGENIDIDGKGNIIGLQ